MKFITKKSSGFTLIELLIVLVIISILTGFVSVNYINFRQRTRDGLRKADLKRIQLALEMYRGSHNVYPDKIYQASTDCDSSTGKIVYTPASGGTETTYMEETPCDPMGKTFWNNGQYYYIYSSPAYTLGACLENSEDSDRDVTSTNPGGSGACSSGKYYVLKSQ